MQDRRTTESSVATKTGTTASHIPTITTLRKSLSQDEINRRNNQALTKSKDITSQDTVRLINAPLDPLDDEEEDDIVSKNSDTRFKVFMSLVGFALMTFLFIVSQYGYNLATYDIEHFRYGQDPMTHTSGKFGLPGESSSKQSYAAALNQNGDITVIVIPPDADETKVYILTSYQHFSNDVIPYITQDEFAGSQALKVTIGDVQWYLVRHGDQFVQAQLQ